MPRKFAVRQFFALILAELLIAQPMQPLPAAAAPAPRNAAAYAQPAAPPPANDHAAAAQEAPPPAATSVATTDAGALDLFVGFADSASPSANFPTPWQGAPNVVFLGGGSPTDAGAIRIDNASSAPVAVDSVTVDLQRANATFSLWQNFTIPAQGSAILTQTQPGNFDTSAYPIVACGGTLAAGETRIPKITVTVGGTPVSFLDTAHVLDTGGFDLSCRGNESLQWRHVGGGGIDTPSGALSLAPATLAGSGGTPLSLTSHLADAGSAALANVVVDFRVVSGPDAGQTGQGVTDQQGNARFTYTGFAQGADVVRASVANASGAVVQSNDATVTWQSASCGPDVPLPPSGQAGLLYIGATHGQYSDPLELAALLTDTTGSPVAGRSLTFRFGDQTYSGVTDATGVARVAIVATVAPADVPVTVDYAGDGSIPALRASSTVTIDREDVLLRYTGKTLLGTAVPQPVSALLLDPDSLAPIANKSITFTVGAVTATAVTDAHGVAATTITLGAAQVSGPNSLTVSFAGDAFYKPASRTAAVTIYLSTSFVIWGGNTGGLRLGQHVNFWGSQWENQVLQGHYPWLSAFKGLADPVNQIHICQPAATQSTLTPDCWVSKGGQTWPPPISVPAYIEVIVSTAIVKSGVDFYGNVAAAVVVKVDPQPAYAPDPGKPGYGVIVAVIEDSGIFPAPAAITATQTQAPTVLPNQQIAITTNITNTSTATAATSVALNETLDGLTPPTVAQSVGTIPAGSSQSVSFNAATPSIPIRQPGESVADYIRRLSSLNGRLFTASGQVTFTDAMQQSYLPVDVSSQSVLAIPVLTLALSGPAVVTPGTPAPYTITVTNVGSAPATATIDVTLPDNTTRTLSVSNLVAGSSFAQIATFTPAAIAPKSPSESTADYLARLAAVDGQLLTTRATLNWRDANGNAYGDVGEQIFSSRIRVPVLTFTTQSPSTLVPGQTATLTFDVHNTGGCTATLANLVVTNPDGTKATAAPFVLGAGQSATVQTTWRVPNVPKKGDSETDAAYLARLTAINNSNLDFQIALDWHDPAGALYGPTSGTAQSKEVLSIVPVSLTAPATAVAGNSIAYSVSVSNVGAAAAPQVDLTVTLPDGSQQKPAVGSLAAGASFQATINYAIPVTQAAGVITASAVSVWTDSGQNAYGPLSASASTTVSNPTQFNSLVLSPAIAGPNVAGTAQTMTATLKDSAGAPISNAMVQFTVTGANTATGSATTNTSGVATFTYTGAQQGSDTVQATSGSAVSNTATVNWIVPVQSISTSPLFARYFTSDGSGVFDTPATATPAFIQAFPTINFNPPAGTIPGNTSGVGVFTRPFTNVTTDLNGNFTGTIIAQGNGLQAGVGTLFNFQAVYTGSLTVASAGNMVINFFSDDGFIFGVGNGATRVSGPMLNVPAGGLTPFERLSVVGAYNSPTAPVANTIVVHFPAAGSYPYEVDYSECCAGQLALTVAAGNVSSTGIPPTGSLKLNPLAPPTKGTGETQTFTVDAFDGSGLPVANAGIALIINGPNNSETSGTTDASGRATISYVGRNAGTDTVQAVGRVAGLGTFSNVVNVSWTVGSNPPPPDPTQPGGNIGAIVTQGWIGSPLLGSVIETRATITIASGVSLVSGILDYWPSSNPAEIKVLNGNIVGGGTVGTIDPTTLANGEYTIRLRGTLSNGTQQTSLIVINVTGENKPGRVLKTVTDLRLPLAGMPVTISRRYDSLERGKIGDFGYGWSLLTSVRLEVDKKNDVTFNLNGRRQTFDFRPQSFPFPFPFFLEPKWVPEPGTYGTLTADSCGLLILSGGTYTCFLDVPGSFTPSMYHYTDPFGRQFDIGADGSMKQVKDLNGNTLTFTRDGIFSSASGVNIPFTRDGQGRITQITDPAGNSFRYGYDANGDLVSVNVPNITNPVQYEYVSDHLLDREVDPRGGSTAVTYYADGRVKTMTDRMGNITQYAYDLNANTTTTTFPDGGVTVRTVNAFGKTTSYKDQRNGTVTVTYDANQNMLTRTNQLGKTWTYTYDANGNVTSVKDPLGNITGKTWDHGRLKTITDALQQVKSFDYDASGNCTALRDTLGQLMGATYDSKGSEASLTLPSGRTAQFTYDAAGNPTTIVDHSGFTMSYEYDELGLPKAEHDAKHGSRELAFDSLGNQTKRKDPLGNTLQYEYDANGNRITETDPNGNVYRHEYDANDHRTKTTFPDGTTMEATYDFAGRPLTKKNQAGVVERYVWDKAGQLTSIVTADGTPDAQTSTFTYDPAFRLNSITDGRNNTVVLTWDDGDRLKSIRDAAGRTTAFTYDAANRVTAVTRADNVTHQTRYDVRNRPTTIINPDGTTFQTAFDGMFLTSVTSEDGRASSFTYDNHSQISSVTDPAGHTTSYVRDEVGNITTVRDANGHETRFEYDAADRMTKKIFPDGSFEQYTYDPDGHLATERLTDGHINRYTWDGRDHMQRVDYFDGTAATFTYTPTGKRQTATSPSGTKQYAYDALDRLTTITEPTGVVISYGYDATNNITSITTPKGVTRYTYDALNRVKTMTDPTGGVTTYTYDLGGRLTQRLLPNGVVSDYGYDSNDHLTSVAHHLGANASFESFQYTLNSSGQRASVREVDGTHTDWTYDDAYRLIHESIVNPAGTTVSDLAFAYDQAGNRTSMSGNGVNVAYQYNQLDQLTSAGSKQYSYDGRGNLTRVADGASTTTYGYDATNRLSSAALPDGSSATFGYDADGRMTRATSAGAVRNFAWNELSDYGDVVYESDGGGAPVAGYSFGAGELVQRLGASPAYALQDGLGSVIGLTNAAGAETDRYRFDAWGGLMSHQGTSSNPFGYRDQWSDPTTSLLYLRARWFSPETGRFMTRDTAAFDVSNPVDLNRYLYAAANPINNYDPTGHSDAVEYGLIARQSVENATIEGYLVGRRDETLLSCALDVLAATFVDAMLRAMIDFAVPNPINGKKIWKGTPNVITIAFGWAVLRGVDAEFGPDWAIPLNTEEGREVMMAKAAAYRAAPREWSWALSGFSVNGIFKLLGKLAEVIAGIDGVFIGNDENLGDKCSNHAERKVVRHADPPGKSALLSVGASRPVCANCLEVLIEKVLVYGGCIGPIGGNNQCRP